MAIFEDKNSGKTAKTSAVSSDAGGGEVFENELRPKNFENYVGQGEVKNNLRVFIAAAKKRGEPLDHSLFYGPPGLGKTTLAMILASEMGSNLRISSGPALEKPGDLAAILTNLTENDFLFIDEIHRLRTPVEEILYTAMEDFSLDLVVGKGPSARTMRIAVPKFTLVGATTKFSMLSNPLRDRFGHVEKLRFYEIDEISEILLKSASVLKVDLTDEAAKLLAKSSRRTPRIANRLLRRMRDFAEIEHAGVVTEAVVRSGLKNLSVDSRGLDFSDQEFLRTLCTKFAGGPAGVSTISAAIGEEISTVEEAIEPFLIREGFLQKTPRGRVATEAAWQHLGLEMPEDAMTLF